MERLFSICILFILLPIAHVSAQLSDIARIDYTHIPGSISNIQYNRVRGLFNYPIKLKKEETYLLLGFDYSNINLIMEENSSFNKNELDDFQILDFNIGYTTLLKNDWRLGARLTPGFSSNLSGKDLGLEDIVISSDIVFINDKRKSTSVKKPWRLILGVSYSGNRGFSFPLPFVSYYRKIDTKWSYNLGVPNTNLQYHLSKLHRLKLYVELDGFTSNIQRGILVDNSDIAESINMSLILAGLQYEFHVGDHIQFFARMSYTLSNNVRLRDENKDAILELDSSNSYYVRTGIRFKI